MAGIATGRVMNPAQTRDEARDATFRNLPLHEVSCRSLGCAIILAEVVFRELFDRLTRLGNALENRIVNRIECLGGLVDPFFLAIRLLYYTHKVLFAWLVEAPSVSVDMCVHVPRVSYLTVSCQLFVYSLSHFGSTKVD